MVTRRCTQRQFLLTPDPEMVNAFIYCLAFAAQETKICVIDFIQMSNHLHDVIYDPEGNAPAFYHLFHLLLAKCVNTLRGRWENVFSSSQPGVVEIKTTEDLIKQLVYVATNPIKAGLVERVDDWPGASGYRALLDGTKVHATRPEVFFDAEGKMPAEIELEVGIPLTFGDAADILAEVRIRVEAYEREQARERARTKRKVVGRYAVLRQRWDASPTSREPRRKLQRTIAAVCRWTRMEALQRRRDFLQSHRAARKALLAGTPIPFPYGTYWVRRYMGLEIQTAPFSS